MAKQNDIRHDPHATFCFSVELTIPGFSASGPQAFFKSVSGLRSEAEPIPYKEGGVNTYTHQLIGITKYPNIVLKKGFTADPVFIQWRWEFLPEKDEPGRQLKLQNGKIKQLNSRLEPVFIWHFEKAWPLKWEGPEFDAHKNELSIETIEICHQQLRFEAVKSGGGGPPPGTRYA